MIAALVIAAGLLVAQDPAPPRADPPPPPALTELQRLQVENVVLREALLRAQIQATSAAIEAARRQIDDAIRSAHPGYAIDWQNGQLVPITHDKPAEP